MTQLELVHTVLGYPNVSGSRSICMLPKITDQNGYRLLKQKYNLSLPIPKNLHDHWNIFCYLANHEEFSEFWTSEIIFFLRLSWVRILFFSNPKAKYSVPTSPILLWPRFNEVSVVFFSNAKARYSAPESPITLNLRLSWVSVDKVLLVTSTL